MMTWVNIAVFYGMAIFDIRNSDFVGNTLSASS